MRISDWSSDVFSSDLLVMLGQMAATDPTRAPTGSESMWAYVHVPQRVSRADRAPAEPVDEARAEQAATEVESRIAEFAPNFREIGRASCRERVCEYLKISVVDASLKQKKIQHN